MGGTIRAEQKNIGLTNPHINMNKADLENNLNRVHEWIRTADQKVGIFLAFQGVVITIVIPKVMNWIFIELRILSWLDILVILIGLVLLFYGLIKSVCALIPRLNKNTKEKSPIYFGDIAEMNLSDFKRELTELNEKGYEDELIKQIHISARIAKTKHRQFRDSSISFLLGLAILGFVYIFLTIPH